MTAERYARHIRLPEIGAAGQQRLLDSRVLIIGMGGLGSPVALYLAAAGVGHLALADYDRVEPSNLQRQIIHGHADIGELKTESARRSLASINPALETTCLPYEQDPTELARQVELADAVVDCSDNFPTRFLLNRMTWKAKTPLVSGAAIRWDGQLATFDAGVAGSPCYRCLYQDDGSDGANCALEGVVAPLVGVIGTMQAQETVNVLLGKPALVGRLLLFDARRMDWRSLKLGRNAGCPVCAADTPQSL